MEFDYQSVRHCSKTEMAKIDETVSLITSQFDTAPKLSWLHAARGLGLITSQFDTAPKHAFCPYSCIIRLITSQFDTAPKLL